MITLLSPAKQLNWAEPDKAHTHTLPVLLKKTAQLSRITRKLKPTDLKALMGLSDDLADLNHKRFKAFDPKSQTGLQAAFAFNGEVYRGLDARSLSEESLSWAQSRLLILSGLYGLLKPLDLIQPYRLEMGTRLTTTKGNTLYDFWGNTLAKQITDDLKDHHEPVIINLASNEYSKAAQLKSLKAKSIHVQFKEEKDGQRRALMVYAKKARGLMARWIIDNRIESHSDLIHFDVDGYRYDRDESHPDHLLFTRPQPALKTA